MKNEDRKDKRNNSIMREELIKFIKFTVKPCSDKVTFKNLET